MSIFKKKGGQVNAANVHMTEAEAALAQSDFNIEKITDIQNKFAGGAVLLVPGRIFIREGLLYKVCRKGLKKRQFFLFNDILVYGSLVAGLYSNQQILPLSQMSVSADCFYQPRVDADFISETDEEKLDVANAFQISHANKSFHVFGQSAADKANWIANLQKHISRVAKTLTDSQQQVLTRPVWVPDSMSKECMICSTKFTPFLRKHHCRRCGRVICSSCSPHRVSLVTGEGGVATVATEGQGKLERTCRECFKEMTAVHNRANSTSSKYDGSKTTPTRPPPPAVAAQLVSAAIRSKTSPPVREGGSPDHLDSSTDTEDSDDSGNEQETRPIPAKRHSTTKPVEPQRPVPVARQSIKSDTSPPIPAARRSIKTSSDESSPTLLQKTPNQNAESVDEEPQPTPPPRKKKLLKQKLKEQQELAKAGEEKQEKQVEEQKADEEKVEKPAEEEKLIEEEKEEKPAEEEKKEKPIEEEKQERPIEEEKVEKPIEEEKQEKEPLGGPDGHTQTESPSSKKTRRRNKFRPQEEAKNSDALASSHSDTKIDVEGGVDSVQSDGVEVDGDGARVEGEAHVVVNGDVPEPEKGTKTDAQTESDTLKEAGSDSPNAEAAAKRGGRRRQKFKPSTPQN